MEENIYNPFKSAGIALLIIGVIDIGVMIYCIANKVSYSSSFNIFAVIAGIFLLRGGVKTARAVRWFSALFISASIALLVGLPFTEPFDLLSAQFKERPTTFVGSFLFVAFFIAVLIWLHRQLSTPQSLAKLAAAGYRTTTPRLAFGSGILILALMVGLSVWLKNSESAQRAKAIAQEQLGPQYKYYVYSLSVSGSAGSATVIAYTTNETKNVRVHW